MNTKYEKELILIYNEYCIEFLVKIFTLEAPLRDECKMWTKIHMR